MGKTNKKLTCFVCILIVVILAGIIGVALNNHNEAKKAAKAVEEWAMHMQRPWEDMEIKTPQDVMRANSMINSSHLSDEEKLKASNWVYREFSKNKSK